MTPLAELNRADRVGFVAICGPLFEHSPWVAERAYDRRPFASVAALHAGLCGAMYAATTDEQTALIGAHPDLVGRLAREGRLTRESTAEQVAAGLATLTADEAAAFDRLNGAYRERFGFPFVICARENRKAAILAAFPARLANGRDREITTALAEVAKIAKLRLADAVSEDSMPVLSGNTYGKSDVRLTKVVRDGDRHDLFEFSVDVLLAGRFAAAYTDGDNRLLVATDSMKNTVYVLAKEHPFDSPEAFAKLVAEHFTGTYEQITSCRVEVRQTAWHRIDAGGVPHPHSWANGGRDLHTAVALSVAGRPTAVAGGVTDLLVLKTGNSAFRDFVTDRYRTLPDADQRIFATSITASWDYDDGPADYVATYVGGPVGRAGDVRHARQFGRAADDVRDRQGRAGGRAGRPIGCRCGCRTSTGCRST